MDLLDEAIDGLKKIMEEEVGIVGITSGDVGLAVRHMSLDTVENLSRFFLNQMETNGVFNVPGAIRLSVLVGFVLGNKYAD